MGLRLPLHLLLQLLSSLGIHACLTVQLCLSLSFYRSYLQRWQQAQLSVLLQRDEISLAWGRGGWERGGGEGLIDCVRKGQNDGQEYMSKGQRAQS